MANDNGPMILGVTWMESGVAVIAVAVRFFARVTVTNNVGIEDWTMLLSVVRLLQCSSLLCVSRISHVHLSVGKVVIFAGGLV